MRSTRCVAPTSVEQLLGAGVVELVVLLPPPAEHAVRRGDHDVVHPLRARDPLGDGGAGQADPRSQLEDVDGAEHLAEDADHAAGRVDLCGRDLQQRGLAGAVGAEHHPALVLLDRPVDPVDQRGLPPPDADVGELENGVHGRCGPPCRRICGAHVARRGQPNGPVARPRGDGPDPARPNRLRSLVAVSTPQLPLSMRFALWFTAWASGAASLDDTRDAIVGDDAAHDVAGLPGSDGLQPLILALGLLRAERATGAGIALPVPGDPLGLAGPSTFNAEVVEAGEGVVLDGAELGLVPYRGRGRRGVGLPPGRVAPPGARPVRRPTAALRTALVRTADALADLDVARWRPEVADELMVAAPARRPGLPARDGAPRRTPRCAGVALPHHRRPRPRGRRRQHHRGRGGRPARGARPPRPRCETRSGGRLRLPVGPIASASSWPRTTHRRPCSSRSPARTGPV